ncbi:MAG TPA: SpoIIIAH-like family protein [Candidatus Merdicola faecigallinarum]|uniref:SpoIIIAH-like family protein n=1 Tax=Candidatus Merdicola faecigallinarum TaxID=2840862 RepID=A0A9D1M110_9FIRM|nr:SpoIIIAH-like family protein [Candidatus Merdicola faecigallinarum]
MNMKVIKKNQVIIFAIALMLMAAGYLSYDARNKESLVSANIVEENKIAGIGDAKLVSSNNVVMENTQANVLSGENITNQMTQETGQVSSNAEDNYFSTSRLGRDTMYSQMIESYQKILENESISQEQKTIATQEINNINTTKNAIMIAENLIKTKGFQDVVIFVNGQSISVILQGDELKQEEIAQVQNIVAREMKAEIENIHISNK